MRKVINGNRYDTETAKLLGSGYGSNFLSPFHWEEQLYRTNSGKFFLYGPRNPNSSHGVWAGDSNIIPITTKHALDWCKRHLSADECEMIFGRIKKGRSKISVDLSPVALEILDKIKKDKNLRNRGDAVEWLLVESKKISQNEYT